MNDFLKKNSRTILMDIAMVVLFLLVGFAYFQEPVSQGMVLGGHNTDASIGQGRELTEYYESHDGETTRWTNSQFSGMPTYQMAPSYSATQFLGKVAGIYELGMTGVMCYTFVFLLGFYILLRAFDFKPYLAALGAILWTFSSYFFIIIGAGHIWKVMTLAFVPPTIGGLVLCYRGKYLLGGAVTALFTAFQILSNHVQMTYYFGFVMFFIVLAYLIQALRSKKKTDAAQNSGEAFPATRLSLSRWAKATGVILVAGLLGVAANLPNIYHTYDYAKQTMRGGTELSPLPAKDAEPAEATAADKSGGLDFDYITQWSYGVDETLTLLIPRYKGGGSGEPALTEENLYDDPQAQLLPYVQQLAQQGVPQPPGVTQYWGNQPMTVGPVYVGAFVCFLFILGLFIVKGPMKWALAAATILSLVFAWGHNVPAVTHFLIDHLPMYNKFRTVSSALVIAEFTMPLLGIMALARIFQNREILRTTRGKAGFAAATVLSAGVCLLFWMFPSLAGNCISANEFPFMESIAEVIGKDFAQSYTDALTAVRHSTLSASAGRSLLIIFISGIILFCAARWKRFPAWAACVLLGAVSLADMWSVNREYLNVEKNFTDPVAQTGKFLQKTPADELILRDKSYYRVLNLSTGQTFNENATSYWHHSIGGYHAAKLQRYQDLIDRQLVPEISSLGKGIFQEPGAEMALLADSLCPVLNMLNMKYVILPGNGNNLVVACNDHANGNGWFVNNVKFVKGADEEMSALTGLDTKHAAIADEEFRHVLEGSPLGNGSVKLTKYEPNELHYDISSEKGGVVVFSEVYYPGWTATVDGEAVEVGRVNYLLRAIKVPAGNHKVVLDFHPATVATTNVIAYTAIAIVLLLFAGAVVFQFTRKIKNKP